MVNHLEAELAQLKEAIFEMMALAKSQMEKAKGAFLACNIELAEEVVLNEKRINAMELSIDRDCERILALYQPVATSLRFVISMLKINADLERIGDYADGIADFVLEVREPIQQEAIEAIKAPTMFDVTIGMIGDIQTAFMDNDTDLARKVYKKDRKLNAINADCSAVTREFILRNPEDSRALLFLFSTIRKLERVGDHVKNIAEDIIFHHEAEVIKHRKTAKPSS